MRCLSLLAVWSCGLLMIHPKFEKWAIVTLAIIMEFVFWVESNNYGIEMVYGFVLLLVVVGMLNSY